jgi:hypothetical protein
MPAMYRRRRRHRQAAWGHDLLFIRSQLEVGAHAPNCAIRDTALIERLEDVRAALPYQPIPISIPVLTSRPVLAL